MMFQNKVKPINQCEVTMGSKWKKLSTDIIIILTTSTMIALLINELRENKIPLMPPYLNSNNYKEIPLGVFQRGDYKHSRCLIFDARPYKLYEKYHLTGALNFPVSQFDFFYHFHLDSAPPDVPIFVWGRTMSRAFDKELAYRLSLTGHKNVTVIY